MTNNMSNRPTTPNLKSPHNKNTSHFSLKSRFPTHEHFAKC